MRKILKFDMGVGIISSASVGGREESGGPLSGRFDITDKDDLFGMESWEMAEGEMCRLALGTALKKCGITAEDIDLLLAGDLENQCVASSLGLYTFGIPYLGLYAACSTATEALLIASSMISSGEISRAATVTSSHNCAAERQFRTPIEYGALRTPTAQWTATAAGAFILDKKKKGTPYISEAMIGKIIDGCTSDGANMGAAMSRAAFDSVYTYFSASGRSISEFDAIFTGDLGRVGSEIFCDLIEREIPGAASIHFDCGEILYDKNRKNLNAGASGCGCSAAVLSSYILPKMNRSDLKNILFLSTGALMSPTSVMQGGSILGIAPLINIKIDC